MGTARSETRPLTSVGSRRNWRRSILRSRRCRLMVIARLRCTQSGRASAASVCYRKPDMVSVRLHRRRRAVDRSVGRSPGSGTRRLARCDLPMACCQVMCLGNVHRLTYHLS